MANKTVHLAGGNNVTLSTAAAANVSSITISGPNTHAEQTAISGIANSQTTYTSGTVSLVGTNNITVLSTTGQAYRISGANTHAQQTGLSGLQNTETTYTSGTVELEGTNNITVFSTTGQRFRISGANTHAQQTGVSALFDGANSISSGTVRLTNANNVTFTINGQTLSGSVHAQQTGISGIQNTETTYTSGTVELEGTNNITVFSTTGQRLRISGANTHAQQTGVSALYDGANSISSGTVRLTNANNITFTINGQTLSGSVHAPETAMSVGVSNLGNTGGDTTVNVGSRLVFRGSNNITLSQSTAAGATTIGINAGAAGGGGSFSAGVSDLGNTAGSTGITGTQVVLVGTGNVTLSQSTNANGATITIDPRITLDSYQNILPDGGGPGSQAFTASAGTINVQPFEPSLKPFPGAITANTMYVRFNLSGSTATMSQAHSSSFFFGIYTLTGNTLSLLNTVSTGWTAPASTNNSTIFVGNRWLSIHSSAWSAQPSFAQGSSYWMASFWRSSGVLNQTGHFMGMDMWDPAAVTNSGTIGVATVATNITQGWFPFYGVYLTSSSAFPASILHGNLGKTQTLAEVIPYVLMARTGLGTF